MGDTLHITSGDMAGEAISKSGVAGEVFVWHDILYDGPRKAGWPDEETLRARARFLEDTTAGGLSAEYVLSTLKTQYAKLESAANREEIVLWFDACLFDQSMLAHLLACMDRLNIRTGRLLCVDSYPGVEPYHGLGQLLPEQLASVYGRRRPVSESQFAFAEIVDRAFANNDPSLLEELSNMADAPLPWVAAAARRWLEERPDPVTGLGKIETLALAAIREGMETPAEIFSTVSVADAPPQYWGDITLWAKINGLADRNPPLVRIHGPMSRLPQWDGVADLKRFRIAASNLGR